MANSKLFGNLKALANEYTHLSTETNVPNPMVLKFKKDEIDTLSNQNLERMGEYAGFTLKLALIPTANLEEAGNYIDALNDAAFAGFKAKLEESKKAPKAGGSTNSGSTEEQMARKIIKMIRSQQELGLKMTDPISLDAEKYPNIGTVVFDAEGNTTNEFINSVIAKDEASKEARLAAAKAAREAGATDAEGTASEDEATAE